MRRRAATLGLSLRLEAVQADRSGEDQRNAGGEADEGLTDGEHQDDEGNRREDREEGAAEPALLSRVERGVPAVRLAVAGPFPGDHQPAVQVPSLADHL